MTEGSDVVRVDEARQAVQDMARRVALLHICYARVLADELGGARGRALVEKAIWEYGTKIGKRTRARVEQLGLEPTVENMDWGSDLSPLGFSGESAVVAGEARSRVHNCPLAEVWREYSEEELGALYCQVDPAKMQAYDSKWTMVHTKKVPAGDEWCEMAVRRISCDDRP